MRGGEAKPALGLTLSQARCLDAIKSAIARDGVPPSYNELRAALGIKSKSHIHQLVTQLEIRGAITRRIGSARSLAPTYPTNECPHCGKHTIERTD